MLLFVGSNTEDEEETAGQEDNENVEALSHKMELMKLLSVRDNN